MVAPVLVLLLSRDPLDVLRTTTGLQSYGYDVLVADTAAQALGLLSANRRISALVASADAPEEGLAVAKAARAVNPKLPVIYTSRLPHRLPEREKVAGAPCLRIPYTPHQLVSIVGQLTGRVSSDDQTRVA
jgi:hypothetical protein